VHGRCREARRAELVRVGEPVTLSLGFRLSCPDETQAIHKVLVIDKSMDQRQIGAAVNIAWGAVNWMDLQRHPASRVAVVEFDDSARMRCDLGSTRSLRVRALTAVRSASTRSTQQLPSWESRIRRQHQSLGCRQEFGAWRSRTRSGSRCVLCAIASSRAQSGSRAMVTR
jgi:hypothetical protein